MEVGIAVLGIVLIFAAYIAGRVGYAIENDKKEKSDYGKMNETIQDAVNEEEKQTRNWLIKTLTEIGCQPEIDDNNAIVFKYQGEEFHINARNNSPIIWIYDFSWGAININDPDANLLKPAINRANESCAVTSLYSVDERNGLIVAHCQTSAYFAYNIPYYDEYIKAILERFFIAHQHVKDELANLSRNHGRKERVEIKGFRNN